MNLNGDTEGLINATTGRRNASLKRSPYCLKTCEILHTMTTYKTVKMHQKFKSVIFPATYQWYDNMHITHTTVAAQ